MQYIAKVSTLAWIGMGFIEIYDMEIRAHGAEETRAAIGKVLSDRQDSLHLSQWLTLTEDRARCETNLILQLRSNLYLKSPYKKQTNTLKTLFKKKPCMSANSLKAGSKRC